MRLKGRKLPHHRNHRPHDVFGVTFVPRAYWIPTACAMDKYGLYYGYVRPILWIITTIWYFLRT